MKNFFERKEPQKALGILLVGLLRSSSILFSNLIDPVATARGTDLTLLRQASPARAAPASESVESCRHSLPVVPRPAGQSSPPQPAGLCSSSYPPARLRLSARARESGRRRRARCGLR